MKEPNVREFLIDDYERVARLWLDAGLGFRLGDDIDSIRVKISRDPDLFLVAEVDGRIVGSAMGAWDGRRGWIYHLGVLPEARRKGVASRLVDELEKRMRKKGVLKVNGLLYPWNAASVSFFSHKGYGVQDMKEAEKQLVVWRHRTVAPGSGRRPASRRSGRSREAKPGSR
jgi:ribosomal protein S18 acetylase RimI-like enzyme